MTPTVLSRRARRPAGLATTLAIVALATGGALPVARAQTEVAPAATTVAAPGSMVLVTAAGSRPDGTDSARTAVGVVVDPSGLILVPASTVAPDAPGVAPLYADPTIPERVSQITISLGTPSATGAPGGRPAQVVAVDGYLDLAIIKVAGGTNRPLNLPALSLSDAAPANGDPVTFVTLKPGPIATQVGTDGTSDLGGDDRIAGEVAWLMTKIATGEAAPGGAFVDADGALVGYPVWPHTFTPTEVWARPAALIEPLLQAARNGTPYTSPYVVEGTGDERLNLTAWSSNPDGCGADAADRGELTEYPSGTKNLTPMFSWSGFTDDEDVLTIWYDADPDATSPLILMTPARWSSGPSGDCSSYTLTLNSGEAFEDGAYGFRTAVGGQLQTISDVTTTVGGTAPEEGVNVTGRVVDADTGKPIKGASVAILKKGTDLQGWFDNPTDKAVLATGKTDKKGEYETKPPVPPDEYPFLVIAKGYRAIGGTLNLTNGSFLDDLQLTKSG